MKTKEIRRLRIWRRHFCSYFSVIIKFERFSSHKLTPLMRNAVLHHNVMDPFQKRTAKKMFTLCRTLDIIKLYLSLKYEMYAIVRALLSLAVMSNMAN